MQSKFKLAMSVIVLTSTLSFGQDIKSSVATVKELIALDNAAALKKAQEDAVKNGLVPAPTKQAISKAQIIEQAPPQFTVRSIYGLGTDIKADMTVDGVQAVRLRQGSVVAGCTVVEIAGYCVRLSPASKKTAARMCAAKTCWTGNELKAESQLLVGGASRSSGLPGIPGQVMNQPMPSPVPQPISQSRVVEAPVNSSQPSASLPIQPATQQSN
jgi:hypothetical protein